MLKGLIGRKIGMTRLFLEEGRAVAVTVLEVGPCKVIQIKTAKKDKYNAVQLGYGEVKNSRLIKSQLGVYKKNKIDAVRVLKEFRVKDVSMFNIGQEIKVDFFITGEKVKITGISKGRGFTGVVKRYNFSGGPATHGCTTHDAPGSIGASADPSKVMKGRRMPGQCGNQRVQIKNLKIVDVQLGLNLIIVKGAVPGPSGRTIFVEKE